MKAKTFITGERSSTSSVCKLVFTLGLCKISKVVQYPNTLDYKHFEAPFVRHLMKTKERFTVKTIYWEWKPIQK